ncbi:MAG TPA: ABC transporter ATP-binding protein [Vicinamibacteria bacterium]|nr:ABC transporter ATP-binding protein [Vicinamibacteria bacterium]
MTSVPTALGDVVLEASRLCVNRGRTRVLDEVGLELRAGEALAVVGPNAAGKSTLVRTLAGLLVPASGEVRLRGRPLSEWPKDALARVLALVTSEEEGPDTLTVADRVSLGRYPHRGPFRRLTAGDDEAVIRALRQTGTLHLADRRLGTLSAGERQLATLARGLAQEPQVLLLDEPAAHLDIGHQLQLFRALDDVRQCGVAVLAVIHDLARAAAWAGRMALVAGGRMAAVGSPADVLGGEAAAQAFGVTIRGHQVPGLPHLLYMFEEGR